MLANTVSFKNDAMLTGCGYARRQIRRRRFDVSGDIVNLSEIGQCRVPLDVALRRDAKSADMASHVLWKAVCAPLLACGCASGVMADAWVQRMLMEKQHDFGMVLSGSDAIHRFPVKNVYKHDVELVGVRSSCGCTEAFVEHRSLQPGQTGYIVASLNTRSYSGSHDATLTIEVAWNDHGIRRSGEATVHVHGVIHGDVIVEPDAVVFDNVQQGTAHEQRVRISSEGSKHLTVKNALCDCDNLEVDLSEAVRSRGRVVYEMSIRLKPCTPAGFLREQLVLVTDNEFNPRIPLRVSGRVVQNLSVSPEFVFFGKVAVGQQVARKVIVRGSKPFRIVSAQSDTEELRCRIDDRISKRHILEIVLQPPHEIGELKDAIRILTDLNDGEATSIVAHATVIASKASGPGFEHETPSP